MVRRSTRKRKAATAAQPPRKSDFDEELNNESTTNDDGVDIGGVELLLPPPSVDDEEIEESILTEAPAPKRRRMVTRRMKKSWPPMSPNGDGDDEFEVITIPEEVYWDYIRPYIPPKNRLVVSRKCSTRFAPSGRICIDEVIKDVLINNIYYKYETNEITHSTSSARATIPTGNAAGGGAGGAAGANTVHSRITTKTTTRKTKIRLNKFSRLNGKNPTTANINPNVKKSNNNKVWGRLPDYKGIPGVSRFQRRSSPPGSKKSVTLPPFKPSEQFEFTLDKYIPYIDIIEKTSNKKLVYDCYNKVKEGWDLHLLHIHNPSARLIESLRLLLVSKLKPIPWLLPGKGTVADVIKYHKVAHPEVLDGFIDGRPSYPLTTFVATLVFRFAKGHMNSNAPGPNTFNLNPNGNGGVGGGAAAAAAAGIINNINNVAARIGGGNNNANNVNIANAAMVAFNRALAARAQLQRQQQRNNNNNPNNNNNNQGGGQQPERRLIATARIHRTIANANNANAIGRQIAPNRSTRTTVTVGSGGLLQRDVTSYHCKVRERVLEQLLEAGADPTIFAGPVLRRIDTMVDPPDTFPRDVTPDDDDNNAFLFGRPRTAAAAGGGPNNNNNNNNTPATAIAIPGLPATPQTVGVGGTAGTGTGTPNNIVIIMNRDGANYRNNNANNYTNNTAIANRGAAGVGPPPTAATVVGTINTMENNDNVINSANSDALMKAIDMTKMKRFEVKFDASSNSVLLFIKKFAIHLIIQRFKVREEREKREEQPINRNITSNNNGANVTNNNNTANNNNNNTTTNANVAAATSATTATAVVANANDEFLDRIKLLHRIYNRLAIKIDKRFLKANKLSLLRANVHNWIADIEKQFVKERFRRRQRRAGTRGSGGNGNGNAGGGNNNGNGNAAAPPPPPPPPPVGGNANANNNNANANGNGRINNN